MNYSAILLAAGSGTRYKGSKQDILFHGKPLWRYAYETTMSIVGAARIVAVGKDIPGGATRTGSVISGLDALPYDTERVVIVEAARPMVTAAQIIELLEDSHLSTTFVRPLVNTVMYRDGTYIDRQLLYELLTPQAFDYKKLVEAYKSGKYLDMTDETRTMYEFHKIKPHFIETTNNLFKITYSGDLEVIESIYRAQMKEEGHEE